MDIIKYNKPENYDKILITILNKIFSIVIFKKESYEKFNFEKWRYFNSR